MGFFDYIFGKESMTEQLEKFYTYLSSNKIENQLIIQHPQFKECCKLVADFVSLQKGKKMLK